MEIHPFGSLLSSAHLWRALSAWYPLNSLQSMCNVVYCAQGWHNLLYPHT